MLTASRIADLLVQRVRFSRVSTTAAAEYGRGAMGMRSNRMEKIAARHHLKSRARVKELGTLK